MVGLTGALVDVLGVEESAPGDPGADIAESGVGGEIGEALPGTPGVAREVVGSVGCPGRYAGDVGEFPAHLQEFDDDGAGVRGAHPTTLEDQSCAFHGSGHVSSLPRCELILAGRMGE